MTFDQGTFWNDDDYRGPKGPSRHKQWNEYTQSKRQHSDQDKSANWQQMAMSYQAVLHWMMNAQTEMDEMRKKISVLNQTIDEMAIDIEEVASDRDTWKQVAFWLSEQTVAARMAPDTPTKEKVQKYLDGFYEQMRKKDWDEDELP